jgi:hypothetical protein
MGKHKKQEDDSPEVDVFCSECGERNLQIDKKCQGCNAVLPKLVGQGLRVMRPSGRHSKKKKK